jgi:hypothetical protein
MIAKLRTIDRIREDVAFVLGVFDKFGVKPAHITAGIHLSAQVNGYQRADEARAEVDRIADALGLAPDDGESVNYDRRGTVTIAGRSVVLGVYTARADAIEV